LPGLQRLAEELAPEGLVILTVVDGRPARARIIAQAQGLRLPVILGDAALRQALAVEAVPWFLIVGPDGRARFALRGAHSERELRDAFRKHLR
jgi:hypothetical protein